MIPRLLAEGSPSTLKRAAVLALPHLELVWLYSDDITTFIDLWVSAAEALECTEAVCEAVVDVLLQMAFFQSVRAHITPKAWAWLNKRPALPPRSRGRLLCSIGSNVLPVVRSRGDTKLLTSYLVTMWSEWDCAGEWVFEGMCEVLREEFCRDGGDEVLKGHRMDLIARLNLVLGELAKGFEYLRVRHLDIQPDEFEVIRERYKELKRMLIQVESHRGWMRVY